MSRPQKILTFCLAVICISLSAQRQITGRVVDGETKKAIIGAKVRIVGDTLEAITNVLGYFQLVVDSVTDLKIESTNYGEALMRVPGVDNFQIALSKTTKKDVVVVDKEAFSNFTQEAKTILKKYTLNQEMVPGNWPYPWDENGDVHEKLNLKKNKVKKVKSPLFEAEYEQNGEPIFFHALETGGHLQLGFQAGEEFVYNRDDKGELTSYQYKLQNSPNNVHYREFQHHGDTTFIIWFKNNKLMGLGLFFKNIFVDKNCETNTITSYLIQRELKEDYFLVSEIVYDETEGKLVRINKHKLNRRNMLLESSQSDWRMTFEYNTQGLKSKCRLYVRDQLFEINEYVRDSNGLLVKYIIVYGSFSKKEIPSTKNSKVYDFVYDYY